MQGDSFAQPYTSTSRHRTSVVVSAQNAHDRSRAERVRARETEQFCTRIEPARPSPRLRLNSAVLDEDASVDEVVECGVRRLQWNRQLGGHDRPGQHEVSRQEVEGPPRRGVPAQTLRAAPRRGEPFLSRPSQLCDCGDELLLRAAGAGNRVGEPADPCVVVAHAKQDEA